MRRSLPHRLDQNGITHHALPWVAVFVLCFSMFVTFRSVDSHAVSVSSTIKSGISGYCLDDHNDTAAPGAIVDSWGCNNSEAQNWSLGVGVIKHGNNQCLTVNNNGVAAGDSVSLDSCSQAAGQVWLRDKAGFLNPNSRLCLSLPNNKTNQQLVVASCSYLSQPYEVWTTSMEPSCNNQSKGIRIACYAEKEWTRWQEGTPNHETLLNSYTDGAPYEEWCADFVSYVYKEAGYPFTRGEAGGWDENIAGNVQYMGFTLHPAGQYDPKPGDVAYFDYSGGHTEIVVGGGKTPTFVYGNSATVDPSTGNGQMEANTIVDKGGEGQVIYYLSPH